MGVSPFPAAKLIDIAQQVLETPFPANLATVFLHGDAYGTDRVVRHSPLAAGKNDIGTKWVCWLVQAVGTALVGLPLWGALHCSGVDCLAPLGELSVKYIRACAGREQFLYKAGL